MGDTMWGLLGRWLFYAFVSMAACFLLTFAGDWVVFHLRGSPMATATIQRYMGVPLKGRKEEYDYLGTVTVPCAVSLFPQNGIDPCWHMRKYPEQWENL
jgi:hypothetical protein